MSTLSKSVTALSAFALVAITMGATATPAAAVGGCPAGKLCIYESTQYRNLAVTSTSTKACFDLTNFGTGFNRGIGSYVNNLNVNAVVYSNVSTAGYTVDGTIRPGGYSSDTTNGEWFGNFGAVCMGGLNPNTEL
ncbi:peptidase inhibitor family I36 protein [[Kitasatospora] papulosa]|uniref:peptidase inhibitor family I36 protein n=1 Tax=[Kitasatospora] papulosa TaxID=1464011 RepID=UPI003688353A